MGSRTLKLTFQGPDMRRALKKTGIFKTYVRMLEFWISSRRGAVDCTCGAVLDRGVWMERHSK